jgi:ABC-type sugar transport system ATPase subunit
MMSTPSVSPDRQPVLRVENVSKYFGAIEALVDVSLQIYPGEIVGLVGDNGAGKSTLVKCVSGVYKPSSGTIFVDEQLVNFENPSDARAVGIETVYQHLGLVDELDVAGNLFLGREIIANNWLSRLFNRLDLTEMKRQATDALNSLHIKIPDPSAPVETMSGGQRQAVAIGRTVFWGKKLLLLDEPTAALGVDESEQVLSLLERLRDNGLPLLVISHNMQHVYRIADRIVVLRRGRKVADLKRRETTPQEIVGHITGALAIADVL